jgi:hypothetical protein
LIIDNQFESLSTTARVLYLSAPEEVKAQSKLSIIDNLKFTTSILVVDGVGDSALNCSSDSVASSDSVDIEVGRLFRLINLLI